MNKREIYFRWAISLCLFLCIVCYQLTRPSEEQANNLLPIASSQAEISAAASAAPSSSLNTAESSAAASSEAADSAPSASEEAAASEEAESEASSAAASSEEASSSSTASSASASSKPEAASSSSSSSSSAASSKSEPAASSSEPASSSTAEPATPRGPHTDGTYSGSGKGFGGKIYVSVTVQNGYIAAISVTSADGEDKPYLRDALQIINTVIATQSTQLDAISGATSTTWGILDAIDDALKGA